ncbi:HD domain-containing protein [Clostridium bovifaecis]|uniref:HD domain-containing protein n=1 Tax=Clostridium bovifaecis TaxID=2184719 RepID=A0A6I6F220_9CLOT|nr:HD domain-containing protein [Clostridium bovifaecis]
MRKISIAQITGNEILAKPIYDPSGRILLAEGVVLKPGYKMRLSQLGILSLYIDDELSKEIKIDDYISEKTRNEIKKSLKDGFQNLINQQSSSADEILRLANTIIDDVLCREEVIINVSDIKTKDQYLFEHSTNVCALSVIMGIHLGYSTHHLIELATGSLLHDLGKLLTPKDVMDKVRKGELSPEEIDVLRTHPLDGYEILNEKYDISYISKAIILMHHEHCDGSGFPLGLTDDKLHETVKLVSICNTFDNLTSDFSGYKKLEVYEALEYLIAMSDSIFDKSLVTVFIKNIAAYPSGSIVKLNTGAYGIVLKQNKAFPLRPVINLIYDEKGNKLFTPKQLDLSEENTLFIVDIVKTI